MRRNHTGATGMRQESTSNPLQVVGKGGLNQQLNAACWCPNYSPFCSIRGTMRAAIADFGGRWQIGLDLTCQWHRQPKAILPLTVYV
jgi:hypothetical protein